MLDSTSIFLNPSNSRRRLTLLAYHFVDPDLGVEMFFGKEGAAEKRGIDFEIGD